MKNHRKPNHHKALKRSLVQIGRQLYEAEYILGTLYPPDLPVSEEVKAAKVIWENGGTIEDVAKALAL